MECMDSSFTIPNVKLGHLLVFGPFSASHGTPACFGQERYDCSGEDIDILNNRAASYRHERAKSIGLNMRFKVVACRSHTRQIIIIYRNIIARTILCSRWPLIVGGN